MKITHVTKYHIAKWQIWLAALLTCTTPGPAQLLNLEKHITVNHWLKWYRCRYQVNHLSSLDQLAKIKGIFKYIAQSTIVHFERNMTAAPRYMLFVALGVNVVANLLLIDALQAHMPRLLYDCEVVAVIAVNTLYVAYIAMLRGTA
ncbi:MAG TPA: hypothetical protein VIH90_02665 [Candidatus Saccharimonadales bacterium]